jgi:hypothetical protein
MMIFAGMARNKKIQRSVEEKETTTEQIISPPSPLPPQTYELQDTGGIKYIDVSREGYDLEYGRNFQTCELSRHWRY